VTAHLFAVEDQEVFVPGLKLVSTVYQRHWKVHSVGATQLVLAKKFSDALRD
jgi:hypothetical protein